MLGIFLYALLKTRYKKYILWLIFSFTLISASIFETLGLFSKSLEDAKIMYKLAALLFSVTNFVFGVYFVDELKGLVRDILLIFISITASYGVYTTIVYDPVVVRESGYWVLKTVRPLETYYLRILVFAVLFGFMIVYLFNVYHKTRSLKRKALSFLFAVSIIVSAAMNMWNIISYYPSLNINIVVYTQYFVVFGFLLTMILDPYFFVFWTGRLFEILVYRDDGVLIYNHTLESSIPVDRLLISSFLSALSNFGSELVLEETKLKSLEFERFSVKIYAYKNLFMAVIGKDISPKIDVFAKNLLKSIYVNLEEVITATVLDRDAFKKLKILFNEQLLRVVQ